MIFINIAYVHDTRYVSYITFSFSCSTVLKRSIHGTFHWDSKNWLFTRSNWNWNHMGNLHGKVRINLLTLNFWRIAWHSSIVHSSHFVANSLLLQIFYCNNSLSYWLCYLTIVNYDQLSCLLVECYFRVGVISKIFRIIFQLERFDTVER